MLYGENGELTRFEDATAEAFLRGLAPLQPQLERFCRRALLRRGEVEDALQSAIGKAYRDFGQFSEGTNFRAWLYRYLTFETLNRNRAAARDRRFMRLEDEPATPVLSIDAFRWEALLTADDELFEHLDEVVSRAVSSLPEKQRSILLLRAIGEFSYREIANILGVPMGTVMGLLSRARQTLRLNLHEYARQQGFFRRGDSA